MALSVLRNEGNIDIIAGIALKIYKESNDWVETTTFKQKLGEEYAAKGLSINLTNGGQYLGKMKPALYFGLLESKKEGKKNYHRITSSGIDFYEAYINKDEDKMVDILVNSINTINFGRNNSAVNESDSDIEAPRVFIKSNVILSGISANEYAYFLQELDKGKPYEELLCTVILYRKTNKNISELISNHSYDLDNGIVFLCNAGLTEDKLKSKPIKEKYILKYSSLFMGLKLVTPKCNLLLTPEDRKQAFLNYLKPLQQIYYGAPGTGKSNAIKEMTGEKGNGESRMFDKGLTFRTTFHPDSDYASFVGAYKPVWDKDKNLIVYTFRPQTFLKAYVAAWLNPDENVALIVEEINRGNCAQIFGDIFQLLDREDRQTGAVGLSKYPIEADIDMQDYLASEFSKKDDTGNDKFAYSEEKQLVINDYYNAHYDNAFDDIKAGKILTLPKNLSILATMNTSDQSLFPMDSAFKRRWEWIYQGIVKGKDEDGKDLDWKIALEGYEPIDWWEFIQRINKVISKLTTSEDKQLGYFFCMPDDDDGKTISTKRFVGKVIFYLWNDVFKDYAFDTDCCKDKDGKEVVLYAKFYESDGVTPKVEVLERFFNSKDLDGERNPLAVQRKTNEPQPSNEDVDYDNNGNPVSPEEGRDYTKYTVNGEGKFGKNRLAIECLKKFVELNQTKSGNEILKEWMTLGKIVSHFTETEAEYQARNDSDGSKRSEAVNCNGVIVYVAHNGYGKNGKVDDLIEKVNAKDWGITLAKYEES